MIAKGREMDLGQMMKPAARADKSEIFCLYLTALYG